MGMRISTNLASISAQRSLDAQHKRQQHASQALSSGQRIVRASDDPAGLAISENLKAEIRSNGQARSNAFNAISTAQVGEGALAEVANLVTRLRELAVQSASDTVGEKERSYLQQEAKSISQEVDRIAKTTKFGNKNLLDGSNPEFDFHVGSGSGKENIISHKVEGSISTSDLDLDSADVSSKSEAVSLISKTDKAFDQISKMRSGFGSLQSRLESAVNTLDVKNENLTAAKSRISDADMAKEASELASANVLQNAAASVLTQANSQPNLAMKLL